jgi:hypothetical protein
LQILKKVLFFEKNFTFHKNLFSMTEIYHVINMKTDLSDVKTNIWEGSSLRKKSKFFVNKFSIKLHIKKNLNFLKVCLSAQVTSKLTGRFFWTPPPQQKGPLGGGYVFVN